MINMDGIILKGVGGFYYVETPYSEICECKARGIFRKSKICPCVGDIVKISTSDDGFTTIDEIKPRRNQLIRPPVANIDRLIIVSSICDPVPNTLIIDKMIALAVHKNIEPILVISKSDLCDPSKLKDIYNKSGIKTIVFSCIDGTGVSEIKNVIQGGVNVFTGNSGVGKSTLLNCIDKNLSLETGNISKKLGRGRHTTRHVELFKIQNGYIADTPGFSTVDIERYEIIKKDELGYCFEEFKTYINQCKFVSCSHTCEKGCKVLEAVEQGKIQKSRHNSYVAMYNEVKDIRDWELK